MAGRPISSATTSRGDDDDDDMDKFERENSFGWDASYAWYLDSALGVPLEAADYDWPAAYATVDTASLLQLLPQIRVITGRAPMLPSPRLQPRPLLQSCPVTTVPPTLVRETGRGQGISPNTRPGRRNKRGALPRCFWSPARSP
jgi:hypothetical protein